ncbi:hypothetical protein F5I97DRAFT_1804089 [Phlebopus sp. FC_14]|nr:hypothetical protein F5I97DRAFT_1804089 [Phlebopus sp. FC_14]
MSAVVSSSNVTTAFSALFRSFTMILFSEVGDNTFFIAAILAMRHPRLVVFAGAFGSAFVMSILSAAMGHLLPSLIPKQWTQFAAGVLFLVFGSKMVMEGRRMKDGIEKTQEEMQEAEEEIERDDDGTGSSGIPLQRIEEGEVHGPRSCKPVKTSGWAEGARNFCNIILGPVFVQAFFLTFLGEWGDRSQIATIALGAADNIYLVILGTVFGHAFCTALAVLGGRYVSTKVSVRHVTLGGAALFLIFGVIYLYESLVMPSEELLLESITSI